MLINSESTKIALSYQLIAKGGDLVCVFAKENFKIYVLVPNDYLSDISTIGTVFSVPFLVGYLYTPICLTHLPFGTLIISSS